MSTVLITGASSGIGLAFLKYYAAQNDTTILTADIQPLPSSAPQKATHHILDVRSEDSIAQFAKAIASQAIDLVIHSIGVRGLVNHLHTEQPGSAQEAETLQAMDLATIMSTFQINTAGSFLLFRAILPNLLLFKQKSGKQAKVVVMSSRMGSQSANTAGAGYAYRASKAALNAVVRSLAVDVPQVVWVLCHPGRVESALVRYKEEGAISGQESVEGLVPIIDAWDAANSGRFYDRFGDKIEW